MSNSKAENEAQGKSEEETFNKTLDKELRLYHLNNENKFIREHNQRALNSNELRPLAAKLEATKKFDGETMHENFLEMDAELQLYVRGYNDAIKDVAYDLTLHSDTFHEPDDSGMPKTREEGIAFAAGQIQGYSQTFHKHNKDAGGCCPAIQDALNNTPYTEEDSKIGQTARESECFKLGEIIARNCLMHLHSKRENECPIHKIYNAKDTAAVATSDKGKGKAVEDETNMLEPSPSTARMTAHVPQCKALEDELENAIMQLRNIVRMMDKCARLESDLANLEVEGILNNTRNNMNSVFQHLQDQISDLKQRLRSGQHNAGSQCDSLDEVNHPGVSNPRYVCGFVGHEIAKAKEEAIKAALVLRSEKIRLAEATHVTETGPFTYVRIKAELAALDAKVRVTTQKAKNSFLGFCIDCNHAVSAENTQPRSLRRSTPKEQSDAYSVYLTTLVPGKEQMFSRCFFELVDTPIEQEEEEEEEEAITEKDIKSHLPHRCNYKCTPDTCENYDIEVHAYHIEWLTGSEDCYYCQGHYDEYPPLMEEKNQIAVEESPCEGPNHFVHKAEVMHVKDLQNEIREYTKHILYVPVHGMTEEDIEEEREYIQDLKVKAKKQVDALAKLQFGPCIICGNEIPGQALRRSCGEFEESSDDDAEWCGNEV